MDRNLKHDRMKTNIFYKEQNLSKIRLKCKLKTTTQHFLG